MCVGREGRGDGRGGVGPLWACSFALACWASGYTVQLYDCSSPGADRAFRLLSPAKFLISVTNSSFHTSTPSGVKVAIGSMCFARALRLVVVLFFWGWKNSAEKVLMGNLFTRKAERRRILFQRREGGGEKSSGRTIFLCATAHSKSFHDTHGLPGAPQDRIQIQSRPQQSGPASRTWSGSRSS